MCRKYFHSDWARGATAKRALGEKKAQDSHQNLIKVTKVLKHQITDCVSNFFFRHIGHICTAIAQEVQQQICPHGKNTISVSWSRQI